MFEITGRKLDLREMTRKEMHAYRKKYVPQSGTYVYDEKETDLLFDRNEERKEWYPTVGIFTKSSEIIGVLTLARMVYSEKRCELELELANESYMNKGYGSEAVMLAVKYLREVLRFERVYAETPDTNRKMIHILEKSGFNSIRSRNGKSEFMLVLR